MYPQACIRGVSDVHDLLAAMKRLASGTAEADGDFIEAAVFYDGHRVVPRGAVFETKDRLLVVPKNSHVEWRVLVDSEARTGSVYMNVLEAPDSDYADEPSLEYEFDFAGDLWRVTGVTCDDDFSPLCDLFDTALNM